MIKIDDENVNKFIFRENMWSVTSIYFQIREVNNRLTAWVARGGGDLYFKVDIIHVKRLSKSTLNTYFFKCENIP